MLDIREPAVAGRFYPGDPAVLERDVRRFLTPPEGKALDAPAISVLSPHAGYVYSGSIAGATFARVRVPRRAIVLCPNHTGRGSRRSVSSSGAWRLPFGLVAVDPGLRDLVVRHAGLELDRRAHELEHAVEVQLPFLYEKNPSVKIVAICLGGLDFAECETIGVGLARAIREASSADGGGVLIVASSDMSHYVSEEVAAELDALAIGRVCDLDPRGLYGVVRDRDISMCGYLPATCALVASRELGATRAELVRYGNSGEVSGDRDQVVGYAGIVVS